MFKPILQWFGSTFKSQGIAPSKHPQRKTGIASTKSSSKMAKKILSAHEPTNSLSTQQRPLPWLISDIRHCLVKGFISVLVKPWFMAKCSHAFFFDLALHQLHFCSLPSSLKQQTAHHWQCPASPLSFFSSAPLNLGKRDQSADLLGEMKRGIANKRRLIGIEHYI